MSTPSDACIAAFERQYDTTWAEPALRNERLNWIACWKAASACQGCAVQQGVQPVGEALCDDHGALPLVGTSAVLYNPLPFGTKLYNHPTQQGLEQDAARYRWLRNESWACYNISKKKPEVALVACVRDGSGNVKTILAETAMDEAIDAALAAQAKTAEAQQMARNGGCGCCANACADRANGCKFVHEAPSAADMDTAQAKQGVE